MSNAGGDQDAALAGGPGDELLDFEQISAEIEAEARRLRVSGSVPPGMERKLAESFNKLVPHVSRTSELRDAIREADRCSFLNVAVPLESDKPGVDKVKFALRKAMAWYMNYLAQQAQTMGRSSVRALRVLAERVESIETRVVDGDLASKVAADTGARVSIPALLTTAEIGAISPVLSAAQPSGRVLVLGDGSSVLLGHLAEASGWGDSYAVETDDDRLAAGAADSMDIWDDDPLEHLSRVGDGSLGGLVIVGLLERISPALRWEMLQLAASKLSNGALMALVGALPELWADRAGPVALDLVGYRPFAPETFGFLCGSLGMETERLLLPEGLNGIYALSGKLS